MRDRLPHLPGLDGLRGIALVFVLGFHGGVSWMRGGYLPITSFFVLSGFLITALLLLEKNRTGRIDCRAFWLRRARRLVPGALLGLAVAGGYVALAADSQMPELRGDTFSSLLWFTNWRFILSNQSYADVFSEPSPLQHYWSLAVEEQFYLVLPVLAAVLLVGRSRRWLFPATIGLLAVASALTGRALHDPGDVPMRVYYGTDTRAVELLIGVLLAVAMVGPQGLRRFTGAGRRAVEGVGLFGLVATLALWLTVGGYADWLFEGGMVLVALLAAAVVLAASQPDSTVSRLLGMRPLAWLGGISYGAYLFHWPLFLWLSPERTGLSAAPLLAVRVGLTIGLAYLSYRFIEQPIRVNGLPARIAPLGWAAGAVGVTGIIAAAGASLPAPTLFFQTEAEAAPPPPAVTATAEVAQPLPAAPPAPSTTSAPPRTVAPRDPAAAATGPRASTPARPTARARRRSAPVTTVPTATVPSWAPTASVDPPPPPPPPPPRAAPARPARAPRTGPVRVLVIGDSLAGNLGIGLKRWGESSGELVVWNHGVAGCPLSRGGKAGPYEVRDVCGWWATAEGRREMKEFAPDVVLVVTGLLETFDRKLPSWSHYRQPGEDAFDRWLIAEYEAAADVFSAAGAAVLWAPPPCFDYSFIGPSVDADDMERRRRYHNRAIVPTAQSSRHFAIANLEGQLCPNGEFNRNVLGMVDARPDGVHLTRDAVEVLAQRWLGPLLIEVATA